MFIQIKIKTMLKSVPMVLIIFISILFVACSSVPKEEKPLWADLSSVNQEFPSERYITALGHAENEDAAIALADGNLAAYFSREISSVTKATQSLSTSGETEEKLQREVILNSQIDLVGVHHTQSWFDYKSKQYFVLAYLNRKEAFKNYEGILISSRASFYAFYNSASNEKSPLKKIKLLEQSKDVGVQYQSSLDFAEVLYKDGYSEYSDDRIVIAETDKKIFETKMNVSMKVFVFEDKEGYYKSLVEKVVSENGYKIKSSDYSYYMEVKIISNKKEFLETITAAPRIEIQIKDDSETVFSFNKTCERISVFKEAADLVDFKIQNSLRNTIENDFAKALKNL